ncbi:MAG: NADH-quinone oxidoreductase subunit C [Myxococcota bacterium]
MSPLLERLRERLGDALLEDHEALGDTTLRVDRSRVAEVLQVLRDDPELRFNFLMDLTAVDYLGQQPRFEVVYHLASVEVEPRGTEPSRLRGRVRVTARVPEVPCELPSVSDLYASAGWMEREVWDLYGIRFLGHPDLRRILLYEEFEGHPLRKDYPKERRQPLIGPRN